MWPNPEFPADFVTFTQEIFNGKLHFLCSEQYNNFDKTKLDWKEIVNEVKATISSNLKTLELQVSVPFRIQQQQ